MFPVHLYKQLITTHSFCLLKCFLMSRCNTASLLRWCSGTRRVQHYAHASLLHALCVCSDDPGLHARKNLLIPQNPSWYHEMSRLSRTMAAFVLFLTAKLIPGQEVSLWDMERWCSDQELSAANFLKNRRNKQNTNSGGDFKIQMDVAESSVDFSPSIITKIRLFKIWSVHSRQECSGTHVVWETRQAFFEQGGERDHSTSLIRSGGMRLGSESVPWCSLLDDRVFRM